jgi:phosphoglycerate dehydrogenase-like enzyme
MNSKPRIVFAIDSLKYNYRELWNNNSEQECRRLGFDLLLPSNKYFDSMEYWKDFIGSADGVITTWGSPSLRGELLESAVNLRIIGHAAGSVAGYIDPEQVRKRDIKVVSANEAMAHSVAEWCLMASLLGVRNVADYLSFGNTDNYKWEFKHEACGTLHGKRVGIWGYGAIAAQYRKMLKPFGCAEILVCSEHLNEKQAMAEGLRKVSLEELFSSSDVIQILAGLNSRSRGRINKELLSSIKDGAVLVNGGRAGMIDEKALIDELRKERFVGVFDVFHKEPLPAGDEIAKMKNVMLTPHNAGYPSRGSYVSLIMNEFANYFNGKPLHHEIKYSKVANMTQTSI